MARVKQVESDLINSLLKELSGYRIKNNIREAYYCGKSYLKNPNISLPPQYKDLHVPVAWPEVVVERKLERTNMLGFSATDDFIDKIAKQISADNNLPKEARDVHRASLKYGNAYAVGSYGDMSKNEPEILITYESPNTTVGRYNRRSRDLDCLLQVSFATEQGQPSIGVLHLRDKTITFKFDTNNIIDAPMSILISVSQEYTIYSASIEQHNRGYIFAGMFPNRDGGADGKGNSEITEVVMRHTDQAIITFSEAALAREIYATPQRYLLGADMGAFKDKDGNLIPAWQAYMDKLWMTPAAKPGPQGQTPQQPTVGQFDAASPAPLFEHIRAGAEAISAASGVPLAQLGYTSQGNPASAEAILAQNEVLIKSAEDRMETWGAVWAQLMKMAVRMKLDGKTPDGLSEIRPQWRSAATVTLAARVDSLSKLVAIGAIQPDSAVLQDMLDLTDDQKAIINKENAAAKAAQAKIAVDAASAAASALAVQQNALKNNPDTVTKA